MKSHHKAHQDCSQHIGDRQVSRAPKNQILSIFESLNDRVGSCDGKEIEEEVKTENFFPRLNFDKTGEDSIEEIFLHPLSQVAHFACRSLLLIAGEGDFFIIEYIEDISQHCDLKD